MFCLLVWGEFIASRLNSEGDLWVKSTINRGSGLTQGLSEHMCRMRDQPKELEGTAAVPPHHNAAPRQIKSPNPPGTRLRCNSAAWPPLFGSAADNLSTGSGVK